MSVSPEARLDSSSSEEGILEWRLFFGALFLALDCE